MVMKYIMGLLGILGLTVTGCQEGAQHESEVLADLAMDAERAREVDILYSDSARLVVRIRGPVMISYQERGNERQEFLDGIRVDFYDDDGTVRSVLTAKMAIRYDQKGLVVLQDSVVWTSVEDQKMETSELIWNENQQKIYNNKFLVVTTPKDTVFGKGFTANQDFSDIVIIGTDGKLKVQSLEDES